jgi:hypothetical protein
METVLITGSLSLTAATILAIGAWIVARSDQPAEHPGADETWSPAALAGEPCAVDAEEAAAIAAATDRIVATVAAAAAEVPDELAPHPDDRRVLAGDWRDLIRPEPAPQLLADLDVEPARVLPIVPGRIPTPGPKPRPGHQPRHLDLGDGETTVEWVAPGWMPPIGARRLALITGDTQRMQAVPDGR